MFLIGTLFITAKADTISYQTYGFRAHYGFIIPHSSAIEAEPHTNPYGFDLTVYAGPDPLISAVLCA